MLAELADVAFVLVVVLVFVRVFFLATGTAELVAVPIIFNRVVGLVQLFSTVVAYAVKFWVFLLQKWHWYTPAQI